MKRTSLLLVLSLASLEAKTATKDTSKKTTSKAVVKTANKKELTITITENNFERDVLKAKRPVILDVYAEWCGPCKRMALVFEEVAKTFKDKKVTFAKIKMESFEDTDKHIKLLKEKLGVSISMVPTMLYIEKGKVIETFVGSQTASSLEKKITTLLK